MLDRSREATLSRCGDSVVAAVWAIARKIGAAPEGKPAAWVYTVDWEVASMVGMKEPRLFHDALGAFVLFVVFVTGLGLVAVIVWAAFGASSAVAWKALAAIVLTVFVAFAGTKLEGGLPGRSGR